MYLNIKLLFFSLLVASFCFGQDQNSESENEYVPRKVGNITVGVYAPIPFGHNFVNNGLKVSPGAKVVAKFNIYDAIYIGPYVSFFRGKVIKPEEIGNYDSTTNVLIGSIVGYEVEIDAFFISATLGVGVSNYENNSADANFSDTGTAVWFSPEIGYSFATYWAVYFAPEIRHEFLDISVPNGLKDQFKNADYLTLSLGIRLNLGSGYSKR